jgi:hypothetical protein
LRSPSPQEQLFDTDERVRPPLRGYVASVTSVGAYGIILAGDASNSKWPMLAVR